MERECRRRAPSAEGGAGLVEMVINGCRRPGRSWRSPVLLLAASMLSGPYACVTLRLTGLAEQMLSSQR